MNPINSASGTGSGKTNIQPLIVNRTMDAGSPIVFQALATHERLLAVQLTGFAKSGASM